MTQIQKYQKLIEVGIQEGENLIKKYIPESEYDNMKEKIQNNFLVIL